MFECPNCGGNLKFDIPTQQLSCEFCDDKFDPYQFDTKEKDAEEQNDFEVTVFTCPQCGGEILSTDQSAAGFCSFCGASAVLMSRISHEKRPHYIIPFQKSKEDCKTAYASMMKHAIFAPNDLRDEKHIDSFRGIYMPYWVFDLSQQGPVSLKGEKSHRSGDYIVTDHYALSGNIDASYQGLSYDASSSFSDSISEALAPYDVKAMKDFTPAFFSGFYADTSDVPAELYQEEAEQFAFEQSLKQLKKTRPFSDFSLKNIPDTPQQLHTKTADTKNAMFPVWFMSYRNGDRVAYASVNGQTGKVIADIPVDKRKYFLGSLLLMIPIFILLNMFLTLIPSTLLTVSGVVAAFTFIVYTCQMSKILAQERGEDDKGKQFSIHGKTDQPTKAGGKKPVFLMAMVITVYVLLGCLSVFLPLFFHRFDFHFVWMGILAATACTAGISLYAAKDLSHKDNRPFGFGLVTAAVALGELVTLFHPVSDLYYYAGVILILVSVFVMLTDIVSYYNILSTRRLPQFDKQGGDDRA